MLKGLSIQVAISNIRPSGTRHVSSLYNIYIFLLIQIILYRLRERILYAVYGFQGA